MRLDCLVIQKNIVEMNMSMIFHRFEYGEFLAVKNVKTDFLS